jgi:hypothetical protein
MAKPLISPLLLENSNTGPSTSQALEGLPSRSIIDTPQMVLYMPRKSTEIKAQVARFQELEDQGPSTQRLLFQKIVKGFEDQEATLASHSYRIQSLEVQLEKARPRKRRKVRTSPNSKFVDIAKIRQAQLAAREAGSDIEDEEEADLSDSTIDYILIE